MICETYHQTGIVVILKGESLWELGTFEKFNLCGGLRILVFLFCFQGKSALRVTIFKELIFHGKPQFQTRLAFTI